METIPLFFSTVHTRKIFISDYQNITFDDTILILCSINITCDCIFITFGNSLIFLTFYSCTVILDNTNIAFDCTFLIFGGTLIFSSHLTVHLSYWAVSTSHVIVLLSNSVVHFFFFLHI